MIFVHWQRIAGFERVYHFHTLRHRAITNVDRATKDLSLTQRFARHANPITTIAYTHPSDEELYAAIRQVRRWHGALAPNPLLTRRAGVLGRSGRICSPGPRPP